MKVSVKSKKGLQTTLSINVDKDEIKKKLDIKLSELQNKIDLKGFRKGKVPTTIIKKQFGKSVYGEVIDNILKESTTKAILDKKLKVAGQPKIDLKTFGEGKDLNFEIKLDLLPEIKLQKYEKFNAKEFTIKVEKAELDERLKNLASEHKNFKDKKENEKSILGDQVTFDYEATVDGNEFEGSKGNDVTIELGKDLFLKNFDKQLVGVKKNDKKIIKALLPPNHPKKELANKETVFSCTIKIVKSQVKNIINDEFAQKLGTKDLADLTKKINDQIISQYSMALNSITKKEILDQIELAYKIEIPKNLIENEMKTFSNDKNFKPGDKEIQAATKRIKLGIILNEYGEQNNIKVSEEEIRNEIQKQVKSMPGQEKLVFDYYQKNPTATQHLQSSLYEEKIIKLIKSKIKLNKKELTIKEAEAMLSKFNDANRPKVSATQKKKETKPTKTKKISKK